jgi:hypothetical protein
MILKETPILPHHRECPRNLPDWGERDWHSTRSIDGKSATLGCSDPQLLSGPNPDIDQESPQNID